MVRGVSDKQFDMLFLVLQFNQIRGVRPFASKMITHYAFRRCQVKWFYLSSMAGVRQTAVAAAEGRDAAKLLMQRRIWTE